MSDSPARSRLLELLPAIIGVLERYLSLEPADQRKSPFLLGIAKEVQLAAGFLADVGLGPDGDLLRQEHDEHFSMAAAIIESEKWASDPGEARRLRYSIQFSGEPEEVRETRRDVLQGMAYQMVERLRRLHQLVVTKEGNSEAGGNTFTNRPKQPSRSVKRGRKPDTDAKADERVWDAWHTGKHKGYAELGQALGGKSKGEVKRAIDRHRHRTKPRKRAK